jgi:hypothetical protein
VTPKVVSTALGVSTALEATEATPCAEPPKQPADSVALALIPDLPANAQNGNHGLAASETEPIHVKATVVGGPGETTATWNAYAAAYAARYGEPPPRSAAANGMLTRFLKLIPREEAPEVAAFYLTCGERFYLVKMHPLNLLVADAVKLRTSWATGRRVTEHAAREADTRQGRRLARCDRET